MRILHTGDWHIGQVLAGSERAHEFRAVLAQLAGIVAEREVDALVLAGDVFDTQNPSGEAQRLFYEALVALHQARPDPQRPLQVVVTAGNHDAAGRLEAPRGLLEAIGTRVVGNIRRIDGRIDSSRHLVPLYAPGRKPGTPAEIAAHVLAVSYPTPGCLPALPADDGAGSPIIRATQALYAELMDAAQAQLGSLPLVVTGHLHVAGGLESEGAERRILVGGEHAVPPDIFPAEATYVALGHLHREQRVGLDTVRYCGSLLPLSATELGYKHSVTLVTLDGRNQPAIEKIELARPVPFWRLPDGKAGVMLGELGDHLAALVKAHGLDPGLPRHLRPYVQVWIDRASAKANYKAEVDAIAEAFPVRLVDPRLTPPLNAAALPVAGGPGERLAELVPEDLFRRAFERANAAAPTAAHMAAFHQVAA
jgi:DNA repair protein SbcD/Mre11